MDWYGALCVGAVIWLSVMAGCGGGASGSNLNNVTVTVSPMSVTIPSSGQVTLQATVKGSPGVPSAVPAAPSATGRALRRPLVPAQTGRLRERMLRRR